MRFRRRCYRTQDAESNWRRASSERAWKNADVAGLAVDLPGIRWAKGSRKRPDLARVAVSPLTVERARIRDRIGGPDAARSGGRRCLSRRNHWRGKPPLH